MNLEDNLYIKPRVLAKSSAEQVIQVKEIAERIGQEIATAEEAREMLKLKGFSDEEVVALASVEAFGVY